MARNKRDAERGKREKKMRKEREKDKRKGR